MYIFFTILQCARAQFYMFSSFTFYNFITFKLCSTTEQMAALVFHYISTKYFTMPTNILAILLAFHYYIVIYNTSSHCLLYCHLVLPLLIDRQLIDQRLIDRQLIEFRKKTNDRPPINRPNY
jgi:hypothetical protein